MKRFHVHIRVSNIDKSIAFYTQLFSQKPNKQKKDYAKWMLDDPKLNFAISNHGDEKGVSHLGFEFEDKESFIALQTHQLNELAAEQAEQKHANCCYAQSQKHWLLDPQGVPWEIFHTFDSLDEYGVSDTKDTICQSKVEHECQ